MKSLTVLFASTLVSINAKQGGLEDAGGPFHGRAIPTRAAGYGRSTGNYTRSSSTPGYTYSGGKHTFSTINIAGSQARVSIVQNRNEGSYAIPRPSLSENYAQDYHHYALGHGNTYRGPYDAPANAKPAVIGSSCGQYGFVSCIGLHYSRCVNDICTCMPGFVASAKSMCVRKAEIFGDACSDGVQCKPLGENAICKFGRCICNPLNSVTIVKCRNGSSESAPYWGRPKVVCAAIKRLAESCCDSRQCRHQVPDSECRHGQCICNDQFVAIGDRHCAASSFSEESTTGTSDRTTTGATIV